MTTELTPLLKAAIGFAYVGGFGFVAFGLALSYRRGRLHPLLLLSGIWRENIFVKIGGVTLKSCSSVWRHKTEV